MVFTVAEITKILRTTKYYDRVFNKINIISIGNGKCRAELKVEEEHSNFLGGLHGGFSATLIDSLSTFSLMTHKDAGLHNVSVNLNTEFLKGARIGDEIEILVDTVKVGKTLAFVQTHIKDKKTGDILVKGSQTLFMIKQ